ncbi:MAG: cob(I)yrinic acid a,c-diamide adenosyltransferase [Candidatus Latescibacteria bacterium]|nr:cob(I)yrinic acid a,c-diamide adenosyltransferase [Candidatus Latescibacterota bacterium]
MRDDGTRIVQIYCGAGKGKTTAAVGQAIRAAGNGYLVSFVQFLKAGAGSGEIPILANTPGIEFHAFGRGLFLSRGAISEKDVLIARSGMESIRVVASGRTADMLLLDEVGAALELGLVDDDELLDVIALGEGWLDMVLTGRVFPESLMEAADLVTRMDEIRHHYKNGVGARRGIEF